jgi:hypothetical protein
MKEENSWLVPPGLHEAVRKFERVVEVGRDRKEEIGRKQKHIIIYGDTGTG